MSQFITDYSAALTVAVTEARKYNRTMQLRATKEYNTRGYTVCFAVGEGHRYGVDAQGEFIEPSTPLATA